MGQMVNTVVTTAMVILKDGRCDKTIYASSEPYDGLPVVALNLSRPESRGVIWEKTR